MKKLKKVEFRVSEYEHNRIKGYARLYGYSSVSEMARDWLLKGTARMNPRKRKRPRV